MASRGLKTKTKSTTNPNWGKPRGRITKKRKSSNRRVQGATPTDCDGIHLKSKLEEKAYLLLKDAGFKPVYEGRKYVLCDGFYPTVPFYNQSSKSKKVLADNSKKVLNITYTPDFIFNHKGYTIIIEMKGYLQDTYRIKCKLFRKLLENLSDENPLFFEAHNKSQLLQAIDIIKNLKPNE